MRKNEDPDRWLMFDYLLIPTPVHSYSKAIFNSNIIISEWYKFKDDANNGKDDKDGSSL